MLRKIRVRLPSGKSKIVYKKRKPKKARCGNCGGVLLGVINERVPKMRNIAKTKKRPERKYSNLCSECSRDAIIKMVREGKNV